ncbi:Crooked neck-like protein 1 [Halocaridina rubra]|uniref:Crooked neck-like protein 1 n=1 Tax=Halocaridina rubra TaxID=373956 RepID=A0AAN8WYN1_HALRR
MERARQVYQMCLRLIPHKLFTFAEIWLLYAKFEIRQKDLGAARKSLGQSLGMCPKHKLFRGYIDIEIKLREFDRCRKLYEKWAEFDPENCKMWIQFATLETMLNDDARARGIYELAIAQPRLDMPEYLWKSYIDYEVEQEEWDRVRSLYERLLERTHHVKVWISYAKCEHSMPLEDNVSRSRAVYVKANRLLRTCQEKEQRLMLLEAWKDFEDEFGDDVSEEKVKQLMPKKVTRRRQQKPKNGLKSSKRRERVEEAPLEQEKEGYEENAPFDPNLDRDDSDVEIGSTSSDSSSDSSSDNREKLSKKNKLRTRKSSSDDSVKDTKKDKRKPRKDSSSDSSSSSDSDEESDLQRRKLELSKKRQDEKKNDERREVSSSDSEKEKTRRRTNSGSSSDSGKDKQHIKRKKASRDDDKSDSSSRKRSHSGSSSEYKKKASRRKSSSSSSSDSEDN